MEYRDYIIEILNAHYASLAKELIVEEETYNRELFIELHEFTNIILTKIKDLYNHYYENKVYIEEELEWCKEELRKNKIIEREKQKVEARIEEELMDDNLYPKTKNNKNI